MQKKRETADWLLFARVFFRVEDFTSNRKHQQLEYADVFNFYDIKSWVLATE